MGKRTGTSFLTIAALLAVLLVALFVATGCGSGTTTTTAAPTETTAAPTQTTAAPTETTAAPTEITAAGPATGTPYKIGVLTTTSGDFGFLGKDIVDTMQMEVDLLNANGGVDGHPLELVIEDDGMDPAKAAASLNKLADNPEILAVAGGIMTFLLPGEQAVAEQKQIVYIGNAPSIPATRAENPKFTFHAAADELVNATQILEIVQAKGLKNVIWVSQNDPQALATGQEFVKQATAAGLKAALLEDTIDVGAMDVTPQVNKLKALVASSGADCIASSIWPNFTGVFLKGMKAAGIDLPMVSYSVTADWSTLAMAGDELNGLMVPGPKVMGAAWLADSDPQKKAVTDFVNRYQAKFNKAPGAVAAGAADTVLWLAEALKTSGPDRAKLRDAVASVKNLIGPYAVRTMGAPGDNSGAQVGLFTPMIIESMTFAELKLQ
jgi:branched-chain amino acid transport system substrate-binding protein